MTRPRKVLTIVGARPQFVKAAPLSRAIAAHPMLDGILVHTGQHFDPEMSQIFFDELGIPKPHYDLQIHGGSHGEMTGRMLMALERVLIDEKPDLVLVPGDTTSTLAGALTAAKLHIPLAHLEAGLRSFNRQMPEEINRVLTDHVSTLLLCPTDLAAANLAREGIGVGVHTIGDVMYDAALFAKERASGSTVLERLGIREERFAIATLHRAENTDERERFTELVAYIRAQAHDRTIVFPVHPRTRQRLQSWEVPVDGLRLSEPLGYLDMHRLLQSADVVFTDSGGLQKEAYFHRVPCVTLRSETEWVETVECGWNRLWQAPDYAPRREIMAYGDGNAAERAAMIIAQYLGSAT